jgi:Cch helix turn helix domain
MQRTNCVTPKTVKDKPVEPYALRALRCLNDFIEINRNNFEKDKGACTLLDIGSGHQERKPFKICGHIQDHYIDIIPNVVKDALKDHKFDLSAVIEQWIKWGVLITNEGRKDYRSTYKDESGKITRPTVYRIDSIKMQEILENGI